MIEYWYIWYEIFEDGVKISEGKYPRSYRYKRNAERRARQMWGVDLYSPFDRNHIRTQMDGKPGLSAEGLKGEMYESH